MKFFMRKGPRVGSPALGESMARLEKVMDAKSELLRSVEEDIAALETCLLKSGAPLFDSKVHGVAWAKWNKGRKRLVFCDDENLGPITEGSPAQMLDAFRRLPGFIQALGDHVQQLLLEEPFASIVVTEAEVIRIGNARTGNEKK